MSEQVKNSREKLKEAVTEVMIRIMQNGRQVKDLEGNIVGTSDPTAADIQAALKLLGRDDVLDDTSGSKDPFAAAMDNVVEARRQSRAQGGKVPPDDPEEDP